MKQCNGERLNIHGNYAIPEKFQTRGPADLSRLKIAAITRSAKCEY